MLRSAQLLCQWVNLIEIFNSEKKITPLAGKNFLLQISVNPQNPSAQLIKKPLENLPEPPTFCMVLRKNLEAGRIIEIN